jgi:ABC-type transport system involved in cytochrome c biogenesis permease subunit
MAMLRPAWACVASGGLGYALILLSAFFSALGLVRAGVRTDRFACAVASVSLLSLCRIYPVQRMGAAAIAGFAAFLVLSALGFWLESLDRRLFEERSRRDPGFAARAGKGPERRGRLEIFLGVGFVFSWLAFLGAIFEQRAQGSLWLRGWLAGLAAAGAAVIGLMVLRRRIEPRLPELEELDGLSYLAALHAFPWLTIHLISGSLWAYDSWGSYWGWQPVQGLVCVVWLYLAWLLHLERGKVPAWAAGAAGFLFVAAPFAAVCEHGFWPGLW